jgi:hypothetical protein
MICVRVLFLSNFQLLSVRAYRSDVRSLQRKWFSWAIDVLERFALDHMVHEIEELLQNIVTNGISELDG